jgi:hypothetical protein
MARHQHHPEQADLKGTRPMDLIDRYLSAVGILLPRDQRDDITAELRDILLTRREERAAELGRPLTAAEDEALLKDFGHPAAVAGRYGRQQSLIGPEIFPIYMLVLKIVLAVIVGSALVTGIVNAAITPAAIGRAVGVTIRVAWTGSFAAIGAVTLVFAIVERTPAGPNLLKAWRVRDLPRLQSRRRRGERWYDHVASIVVNGIFLLWWTGAVPFSWQPLLVAKPGQSLHFALTPVWHELYWPIIVLSLLVIAVHALKLAGWAKRRLAYALDLVLQAGVLATAGVLVRAGQWAIVAGSGLPADSIAGVQLGVNIGAVVTLTIVAIVAAFTLVWDAWRLYRPAP